MKNTTLQKLQKQSDALRIRIYEIQEKEAAKKNAALVGKHFKYMNTYGVGDDCRRWPMYLKVLSVTGSGLLGFQFSTDSRDQICIGRAQKMITFAGGLIEGWQPITRAEFQREWRRLTIRINAFKP